MLQDRRWGCSSFRLRRSALLVGVYSAVFNPLVWLFILPSSSLPTRMQRHGFGNPSQEDVRRRLRRLGQSKRGAALPSLPFIRMELLGKNKSEYNFTYSVLRFHAADGPQGI